MTSLCKLEACIKSTKGSVKKRILRFLTLPMTLILAAKRRRFAARESKRQDVEGKTDQESLKTPGFRPAFLRGC